MTWINERRSNWLTVQEVGEHLIRFHDNANGEYVTVHVPGDLAQVTMTVTTPGGGTVSVGMETAAHFIKGEGMAARDVWHFISAGAAKTLRAGLTVHHSAFSSTPHRFERSPETGFEEAFYFLTDGKGLLEGEGLWYDGTPIDAAWPIRNRTFAQVPMGWHRVMALPDVDGVPPEMAYIWCYLCLHERWEK